MADPDEPLPTAPPDAARLAALGGDLWKRVVPHLRRALGDLPDEELTGRLRQLVALPATRLAGGRARRDVEARLAEGGPLWLALRRRLLADRDLAATVGTALQADAGVVEDPGTGTRTPAERGDDRTDRLRSRLRTVIDERDEARRRADGERARADREAAARVSLEEQLATLRDRVAALEARLRDAADDRRSALERERRRGEATVADLREQLRTLRREREDEVRRARAAEQAQAVAADRPPVPTEEPAPARLVPGRPSRLPDEVRPRTTEAARLLLHAGRRVLVDGYNVTRTHQPGMDLEGQRRWLVNLLAGGVAARRIEAVVVFDGHGTPGRGSATVDRGVRVQFTAQGVTADDDIVFQVDATDPGTPVVVVTDDRGLRDRLAPFGVDLLPTGSLLGVLR